MPRPLFVFRWPDRTALGGGGERGKGEIVTRCRCAGAAGGCDGEEWAGEGAVWRGRRGKSLGLMSFLLLRPVGASGGGDPFCRCAGRREGAAAGRSLCRRCSGGGCLVPCRRGLSGLVQALLSAAPSPLHGGGVEGSGLFWRLGSPPGFPGIFVLLSRGRFTRRGERGADALLAGGMMGELGPLSGGMRCPFARRESVWAEGRGCWAGSWPAVRGGPGAVPTGERGLSGMEGESAAPARPRRGARRRGDGVGGGWGEGALPQLSAGRAGGGLPMEKGAAVCYND